MTDDDTNSGQSGLFGNPLESSSTSTESLADYFHPGSSAPLAVRMRPRNLDEVRHYAVSLKGQGIRQLFFLAHPEPAKRRSRPLFPQRRGVASGCFPL